MEFPAAPDFAPSPKIVVCLGRSCRKYNSEAVLAKLKAHLPENLELMVVQCLGQCGNGPMVLVEGDQTWYSEVHPDEVELVIKRHLLGNTRVKEMLYPKFHPEEER